MIEISQTLANIAHLLLNSGVSYKINVDQWFTPVSKFALANEILNGADSSGCYYPSIIKRSCYCCGANLCLTRQYDSIGRCYSYSYKCEINSCSGKAEVTDFNSLFATKMKHSLHFDDVDFNTRYHRFFCKKCSGLSRMRRTYFGSNFWLVCEKSEACGSFFIESAQNRKHYGESGSLSKDSMRDLTLQKSSDMLPANLVWDGFESRHLDSYASIYKNEIMDLYDTLISCGLRFADNQRTSDDIHFCLLALYFSNLSVAAAVRLSMSNATYMKKEKPILQICRTPGGAEFVISALRKKCEQINSYRAMSIRQT